MPSLLVEPVATAAPHRTSRDLGCASSYVEPILVAVSIATLVVLSRNIATIDQSDYGRAIDLILTGPIDGSRYRPLAPPTAEWGIRPGVGRPSEMTNSASVYFWLIALLQRAVRGSFSIVVLGSISKTLAVLLAAGTSQRLSTRLGYGRAGRWLGLVVFPSCFFTAHNVLFLESFYQEHVMYLALPLLVFGLLDDIRWRRNVTVTVAITVAGSAKIQYFYLPGLFVAIVCVADRLARRRLDRPLVGALIAAQLLCAFLVTKNNDRDYNYYHSTYFGSYYFLSPAELDELGVPPENRRCIGVDAFGVGLAGVLGEHEKDVHYTCYVHRTNVARTAIEPYLRHPLLLLRLWWFAASAHWTSKYFLMDVDRPYIAPVENTEFGAGRLLLLLTDLHDRWISKWAGPICAVALVCGVVLARRRRNAPIVAAMAFLMLCLVSQIVVALVGEGMRDLSKHWAVAQLCLDLLVALTAFTVPALLRRDAKSPEAPLQ